MDFKKQKLIEAQKKYRASEKYKMTRRAYEKNSPVFKAKNAKWRCSEKGKAFYKCWKRPNPDQRRVWVNAHFKKKYANDSQFRLRCLLRGRIRDALKGRDKTGKTLELLGCSIEHLRVWLTFYFQTGMTWANQGKVWHIDHRQPCASFDLSDPEQQRQCFHYTNLQPLFVKDNLEKGKKLWLV